VMKVVAGANPSLQVTVSIGVSFARGGAVTLDELLSRADKCLYAAKQGGRNRTVIDGSV
jgi:diguanylate cyclase (GGDEF)-like protein